MAQSEALRDVELVESVKGVGYNSAGFTVRQDDSSPRVTEKGADYTDSRGREEAAARSQIAPEVHASMTSVDGVDVALAEAIKGATIAGRWDIVAQLARELEARRLARARNVVPLRDDCTKG